MMILLKHIILEKCIDIIFDTIDDNFMVTPSNELDFYLRYLDNIDIDRITPDLYSTFNQFSNILIHYQLCGSSNGISGDVHYFYSKLERSLKYGSI